jgi:phospholipid N-methyltransferase
MTKEKEYISAVDTAKLVRKALKRRFPGQTFYVRTDTYSGGAAIDVYWMDGPTEDQVSDVTAPFEGAGFDGMIDLKYYYTAWLMPDGTVHSRSTGGTQGSRGTHAAIEEQPKPHPDARRVHFGANSISLNRSYSREFVEQVAQDLHEETGWDIPEIMDQSWFVAGKKKGTGAEFGIDYGVLIPGGSGHWDALGAHYNRALAETSAYEAPECQKPQENDADSAAVLDGVRVEWDRDWLWVYFPAKPPKETRDALKDLGARWSRKRKGWYIKDASKGVAAQVKVVVGRGDKESGSSSKPCHQDASEPEPQGDPKRADYFWDLADRMNERIEEKRNPAIANLNWTRRRAEIASYMRDEADEMAAVQCALFALSDAHATGTVPDSLAGIRYKNEVELLLKYENWPGWEEASKRMHRAGINAGNYEEARATLLELADPPDHSEERALQELESEVRGWVGQIDGFYPTPEDIARRLVRLAEIKDGHTILEPSAGGGAIADVIMAQHPDADLDVIELHYSLADVLERKGYEVIGTDFFEVNGQRWDRIIQNPPFENLADIDHVRHAYEHLAEGGRLVSVMGESPFFRRDRKAQAFRTWLFDVGGRDIELEQGAFAESGTNVKARIVVIDR